MKGLTITITQDSDGESVHTEIWSPGFVDHAEHHDVESSLVWIRERLDGANPFEE